MSVVVVHFIFDIHFISLSSFHFCIFIFIFDLHFVVVLHLSMFFIHNFFSTSSLTLLWTITGFLHPCYNFSLAHRRLIRDTFIFNHSVNLLAASATVLRGQFLPTGVFYFALLHRHFNLLKASLGAGSSFMNLAGLHTGPQHRPGPAVCLIHSNPRS